jgi:hypothetical protein
VKTANQYWAGIERTTGCSYFKNLEQCQQVSWKNRKGTGSLVSGYLTFFKKWEPYYRTVASIYLWGKVVWFVLFWNRDASDCVFDVFRKLWTRRGAWAWFHDVWTCSAKVLEYWMISSLKIKLNRS